MSVNALNRGGLNGSFEAYWTQSGEASAAAGSIAAAASTKVRPGAVDASASASCVAAGTRYKVGAVSAAASVAGNVVGYVTRYCAASASASASSTAVARYSLSGYAVASVAAHSAAEWTRRASASATAAATASCGAAVATATYAGGATSIAAGAGVCTGFGAFSGAVAGAVSASAVVVVDPKFSSAEASAAVSASVSANRVVFSTVSSSATSSATLSASLSCVIDASVLCVGATDASIMLNGETTYIHDGSAFFSPSVSFTASGDVVRYAVATGYAAAVATDSVTYTHAAVASATCYVSVVANGSLSHTANVVGSATCSSVSDGDLDLGATSGGLSSARGTAMCDCVYSGAANVAASASAVILFTTEHGGYAEANATCYIGVEDPYYAEQANSFNRVTSYGSATGDLDIAASAYSEAKLFGETYFANQEFGTAECFTSVVGAATGEQCVSGSGLFMFGAAYADATAEQIHAGRVVPLSFEYFAGSYFAPSMFGWMQFPGTGSKGGYASVSGTATGATQYELPAMTNRICFAPASARVAMLQSESRTVQVYLQ